MDNKPRTFGETLRRTTRLPLLVRPLIWGPHHLEALCLSMEKPHPFKPQRPNKTLPAGSIDQNRLRGAWFWDSLNRSLVDYHLSGVIISIIDSIHEKLRKKPFKIHFENNPSEQQYCTLQFNFGTISESLSPEILFTTQSDIPFLVYSSPSHKTQLRQKLSLKTRLQSRKILHDPKSTKFDETIDPYDAACLIAMAQEQLSKLPYYPNCPNTNMYTVYLLAPASASVALELFTAHISAGYLVALKNHDLEIMDRLVITREIIELPQGDLSAETLSQSALIDKISEILEQAYDHHEIVIKEY